MISQSLITLNEPHSIASESYKMMRTNLNYMNIDKVNQVILFTSTTSEEGKTTTICNAAITYAQANHRVLLVEADLRKARIHELFAIPQTPGLTNILADKKDLKAAIQQVEEIPNLDILTAGPLPPNPSEILASHAFEQFILSAREQYDVILIDSPPILSLSDAAIITRVTDGVVLILATNETKKEGATLAKKALEKVNANLLGVVLTKAKLKKDTAYYYYYTKDTQKKKTKKRVQAK